MANYGTVENPARLDLYQRIVEVGWGTGWSVLTLDTPEPGLPSLSRGWFPIFPSGDYDPNVELYMLDQDPPGIDKFNWAFLIEPDPHDLGVVLYHDETHGRDKILIWSYHNSPTDAAYRRDAEARGISEDRIEEGLADLAAQREAFRHDMILLGYVIEDYDETYIVYDGLSSVTGDNSYAGSHDYPAPVEIFADQKRFASVPDRHYTYALKYEHVDPGISERKLVRHCFFLNTVGAFREDDGIMEISQSAGHDEKLPSYMNKYTLDKYDKSVVFKVENGKFVEVPPAEGQPSKLKSTVVKEVPYDKIGLVLKVTKGGFVT